MKQLNFDYKGGIVIEVLGLMGFSFGMIGFIFATTVQARMSLLEKRVEKLEAQLNIKSPLVIKFRNLIPNFTGDKYLESL